MSDTPETDAATHDLSDYGPPVPCSWGDWVSADYARKLERERDEAREDAAHWKAEYEIVEARLCGWKHPRDNGIIFEHEVIPRLEAKIAQLEGKTAKPEPLWYNQREISADIKEETK